MGKILPLLVLLGTLCIAQDDRYVLHFSVKESNCTLVKNGKSIPMFDNRFKVEPPKSSYTCYAVRKEQYKDCRVLEKKNVTAMLLGYGSYQYTNFVLAFKGINRYYDSLITVECSKDHYYRYENNKKNRH